MAKSVFGSTTYAIARTYVLAIDRFDHNKVHVNTASAHCCRTNENKSTYQGKQYPIQRLYACGSTSVNV